MYLYKINNEIYPNKYFNFSLSASNLNLAQYIHKHNISDIINLQNNIEEKADINHQHSYVNSLYTITANLNSELINITINTDILNQNDNKAILELNTNNTISIKYISPRRGYIDGAVNKNTLNDQNIIKFYTGEVDTNINDDVCIIEIKENQ